MSYAKTGLTLDPVTFEVLKNSFITIVDVAHFMPIDELKKEMDRFVLGARQTRKLPGMDRAELAGGNEWHWERDNRERGIPMSDEHMEALQVEAERMEIETPFAQFEATRF